mgnify:CR=1 FL=1
MKQSYRGRNLENGIMKYSAVSRVGIYFEGRGRGESSEIQVDRSDLFCVEVKRSNDGWMFKIWRGISAGGQTGMQVIYFCLKFFFEKSVDVKIDGFLD